MKIPTGKSYAELENELASCRDAFEAGRALGRDERDKLREALQRNIDQARKVTYDGRNHRCDWRDVAEAMIQRAEQALKEQT